MDDKFHSKVRKLFETRLSLENELLKGHSLLLEYIENNSRIAQKLIMPFTNIKLLLKKLLTLMSN